MVQKKIATERRWVRCTNPACNAKCVIFDNTADCHGVYLKCSRGCKQEFELIIENGEQVFPNGEAVEQRSP